MRYSIDSSRSGVTAIATSNLHDTTCKLSRLSGWIETDLKSLLHGQGTAHIEIDMRTIDAGDALKNMKLRSDLDLKTYPGALFELDGIEGTTRDGAGLRATILGRLRWRDREKAVHARAQGTLSATELDATATFSLDMRDFNLKPPRVLMFRVEPVVTVTVQIHAHRSSS